MSRRPLPTPVKFLATYLVVFGAMVGWWVALQASTSAGAPVLTVLVAYTVPVTAWAVVYRVVGRKRHEA